MAASPEWIEDGDRAVLGDPRRWRLAATGCAEEVERADDPAHRRWSQAHAHAHPHAEMLVVLAGDVPYGHPQGVLRCTPGVCLWFDAMQAHDDGYPFRPPHRRQPPATLLVRHLWLGFAGDYAFGHLLTVRDGRIHDTMLSVRPMTSEEIGVDLAVTVARWRSLVAGDPLAARLTLLGVLPLL